MWSIVLLLISFSCQVWFFEVLGDNSSGSLFLNWTSPHNSDICGGTKHPNDFLLPLYQNHIAFVHREGFDRDELNLGDHKTLVSPQNETFSQGPAETSSTEIETAAVNDDKEIFDIILQTTG